MRSYKSKGEFIKKVKKPRIQQLVANVDSMSENDIKNLKEACWVREALLELKKNNQYLLKVAEISKYLDDNGFSVENLSNKKTEVLNIKNPVFRYVNQDRYINVGKMQLLLETNDYVYWYINTKTIKVNYMSYSLENFREILSLCNYESDMTYNEYIENLDIYFNNKF